MIVLYNIIHVGIISLTFICFSLKMKKERAEFFLKQAFQEDDEGNVNEAANLFVEAAELCLQLVRCLR